MLTGQWLPSLMITLAPSRLVLQNADAVEEGIQDRQHASQDKGARKIIEVLVVGSCHPDIGGDQDARKARESG